LAFGINSFPFFTNTGKIQWNPNIDLIHNQRGPDEIIFYKPNT
jgi:hypothetical protein